MPSTSLKATIAEGKKKLAYPFQRSTIIKLETRLRSVNTILQIALQSLEMYVYQFHGREVNSDECVRNVLSEVHEMVLDHKGISDVLLRGIAALQSDTTTIKSSICSIQQSFPSIMENVQDLGPLIETQLSTITSRMDQDRQGVHHNIWSLGERVEASLVAQRLQLDRIEAHLALMQQAEGRLRRVKDILHGAQHTTACKCQVRRHPISAPYSLRLIFARSR